MKYTVEYDNESDGETIDLTASDLPILGVEPDSVEDGFRATYTFPDGLDEDEILDDLDGTSDWSFLSASRVDDGIEP